MDQILHCVQDDNVNMKWLNILHFYQPANTEDWKIKEAVEKSYIRIVRALEDNPKIRFGVNITGCLLLRMESLGYSALIGRISKLIRNGQLELLGSAAYHPLLPLIPANEAAAQIRENEEILKKFFGVPRPSGFFLPELAYSVEVAQLIKKLGYDWIILDQISKSGKFENAEINNVYLDKASKLKIIFRSRLLSKSYPPDELQKFIINKNENKLFITATDAELYGLRHEDPNGEFEKLLNNPKIQTILPSEFIANGKNFEKVTPVNSNWDASEKDLSDKLPFALWQNKKNPIQKKLWQLAGMTIELSNKNKKDKNFEWSRWHLVRGLASCTFWWASGRDFRKEFGPLAWSPDEVERGANDLIRAIRSLDNKNTKKDKVRAEKILAEIRKDLWISHWSKYWLKL
jgi:alpha-amylase/alpha-mannosidase (GH57 family)